MLRLPKFRIGHEKASRARARAFRPAAHTQPSPAEPQPRPSAPTPGFPADFPAGSQLASSSMSSEAAAPADGTWPDIVSNAQASWPELVQTPSDDSVHGRERTYLPLSSSSAAVARIQARARGYKARREQSQRLDQARQTNHTRHMAVLKLQCRQRSKKAREMFKQRKAEPLPRPSLLPSPIPKVTKPRAPRGDLHRSVTFAAPGIESPRDAWSLLESLEDEIYELFDVSDESRVLRVRAIRDRVVAKAYKGVMAYRHERQLPLSLDPASSCSELNTPQCVRCFSFSFFAGEAANRGLCYHCLHLAKPREAPPRPAHELKAAEAAATRIQARMRGQRARREVQDIIVAAAEGLSLTSEGKLMTSRPLHELFRSGSAYLERAITTISRAQSIEHPGKESSRDHHHRRRSVKAVGQAAMAVMPGYPMFTEPPPPRRARVAPLTRDPSAYIVLAPTSAQDDLRNHRRAPEWDATVMLQQDGVESAVRRVRRPRHSSRLFCAQCSYLPGLPLTPRIDPRLRRPAQRQLHEEAGEDAFESPVPSAAAGGIRKVERATPAVYSCYVQALRVRVTRGCA